ncbi:hypothetical protein AB3R30_15310 [Leptolyngbyaceae cyanobacterium UHCC 1019]
MDKVFTLISVAIALAIPFAAPTHAQVAEIPVANKAGDFTTARVLGNRGYYRNTHWLVVDPNGSLNCRATPNGAVTTRLSSGWIVTAAFPANKDGDAIVMGQSGPWLRVIATDPLGAGKLPACLVRANRRYIAPISLDYTNKVISKKAQ